MKILRLNPVALFLLLFVCTANLLSAQITVEGVTDKNYGYTDSATFRVLSEAGYDDDAWLNGSPVPLDEYVTVGKPDYYELFVRRIQDGTGTETTRLVRFIIKSSNRGSTERGLVEWTPYPLTPSASNEFAGSQLNLMLPQNYPQGLEIPVIAMVDNGAGSEQRVNGAVAVSGHTAGQELQLLRGHGSLLLPAATGGTTLNLGFDLHTLSETAALDPDDSTIWTPVNGTLSGATTWPAGSRIYITGNITIPSTAHLTVGAGSVIKLDPLVNIYVDGRVTMNGTAANPVVWAATGPVAPEQHTHAWGGFLIRGSSAVLHATGTILFGGGGATSFDFQNSASHRDEQPVLFVYDGAETHMTNCAIINTAGQVGNGYNSELIFDHCLFQRAITAGEYAGSSSLYIADHCAIIEFPSIDGEVNPSIADSDYDALYFTEGEHILRDSLIGFCKDDAIDSGSGGAGTMALTNCWVEAALHEALAWSGGSRETWTINSVLLNSGQGLECGYSSGSATPLCYADGVLALNNGVGARFGDNYDWSYNGELYVTNSLLLHNYRDILGREWDSWNWRSADMDLRGNLLSTEYAEHPGNALWDPAADSALLIPFMTTPPDASVGIGLALWTTPLAMTKLAEGVPVRLSSFTTNSVAVDYEITDAVPNVLATGTVVFAAGETLKHIYATDFNLQDYSEVRIVLSSPVNGELTGETTATYTGTPALPNLSLAGVTEPVLLSQRIQEGVFLFLDEPSAGLVSVDYTYESSGLEVESGTFVFAPPATWQSIMPQVINPFDYSHLDLTISSATGALLSGTTSVTFTNPPLTVGFSSIGSQTDLTALSNGLPVTLTGPAPSGTGVDYILESPTGSLESGSLVFTEGESVAILPQPTADFMQYDILRIVLENPSGAPLGDPSTLYLVRPAPEPEAPGPASTLIAAGATWHYWDAGTDLGTTWRSSSYDSSGWPAGPAQLGFSGGTEGDEATLIADNNQITTYFRHSFVVADAAAFSDLPMWMLRDDGAVVYLNGTELFRSPNMPIAPAPITYLTIAEPTQDGENTIDTATLAAGALVTGTNTLAVEMHQTQANSSDVSFDFELEGNPMAATPPQHVYLELFGEELVVAWSLPDFLLEHADDLDGPWNPAITNSPLVILPADSRKFYRLLQF